MRKVYLVYSRRCVVALEWARYLDKVYEILSERKKKGLGVEHLPVEDMSLSPPHGVRDCGLEVVLVSRPLLGILGKRKDFALERYLHPDRVLVITLGLGAGSLLNSCLESMGLRLEAKDKDTEFVERVLTHSAEILSSNKAPSSPLLLLKNPFSLILPQGREGALYQKGERSVLLIFRDPLSQLSSLRVYIQIMHKEEIDETTTTTTSSSSSSTNKKEKSSPLFYSLEDLQILNPYNLQGRVPLSVFMGEMESGVLSVEIDGVLQGKRTISLVSNVKQFKSTLNAARDPIRALCEVYDIDPPCLNRLDGAMTQTFAASTDFLSSIIDDEEEGEGECPTYLHFASKYGLEKFSQTLLDFPNFEKALHMPNNKGCTPLHLAQNAGFHRLARMLLNKILKSSGHEYSDIQEDYSIPPAPRPFFNRYSDINDPYGTMKGNRAISRRFNPKLGREFKEDLAVADELLQLLDDFQKNSYSSSEMENIFKKWRKKKAEGAKIHLDKKSAFKKLFPWKKNEDCLKANHEEMSVVVFPPTPEGKSQISSQILPLSRLSSTSSYHTQRSLSPPNAPNNSVVSSTGQSHSLGLALNQINFSPLNAEEEESILNTPKALVPKQENKSKKKLFSSITTNVPQHPEECVNLPSMIITDFD